jgi:hypothetical protein
VKKLGKEDLKIPVTKEGECTMYENPWNALKESCQINILMMDLKS